MTDVRAAERWSLLAGDIFTVSGQPWAVMRLADREWIFRSAGFDPPEVALDYPSDGLLVCMAGSMTVVDPEPGDPAAEVVAVADILQVLIMDELGRPWPEHRVDGRYVGVLSLRAGSNGEPAWMLKDRAVVSLGSLS